MKPDQSRYQKQIRLPELGAAGQQKLSEARVLVVGAGGLGCPALQYLAAAGIGRIGIVDFDVVELSNLHRQVLFTPADLGASKAETAARRLTAQNPELQVDVFSEKIDAENALSILSGYDLVIDGSDNFPTRYLINDACVLLNKPLVYGSIFRFEGQVSVFNLPVDGVKTNYRDLFPTPPDPGEVASCEEAGVLGVLPGIIGTMQANEAIKIIAGLGVPLANRLFTYNALNNQVYELEISPRPGVVFSGPTSAEAFRQMDYDWFCDPPEEGYRQLIGADFDRLIREQSPLILDVRNLWEMPQLTEFDYLRIPLSELETQLDRLQTERPIVVFCQTGIRSITAARLIAQRIRHPFIYNLKGGITQWKRNQ